METPDSEFGDQLWDSEFKGSIDAVDAEVWLEAELETAWGTRVLTLSTLITVDGEYQDAF